MPQKNGTNSSFRDQQIPSKYLGNLWEIIGWIRRVMGNSTNGCFCDIRRERSLSCLCSGIVRELKRGNLKIG